MEKVFITGRGVVSSLGNNPSDLYRNLEDNKCAFKKMDGWEDYNGLYSHVGAPAFEYEISNLSRNIRRSMSPMSEMAYVATSEALADADLDIKLDNLKSVMIIGSTTGSPINLEKYYSKIIENKGPKGQLSTSFFKVMSHTVPTNIALALGYSGPLLSPSSACSTSTQSVVLALQLLRAGIYDVAIVGGADELHYSSVSVFDVVKASSRNFNQNPQDIPGPFSKERDGLVVSEGAGILILESERHMKARGKKPYAEVCGGSYMCDGVHMSQPQRDMMAKTMKNAIEDAGLSPSQISYVNAHATCTTVGDLEEAKGIGAVFEGQNIPVSSLKGHLGHSLAACGTVELISIIEMMKNKKVIGNRNVQNVSEEFDQINVLRNNLSLNPEYVLSNNFAFGGMNASVIIKNLNL